METKIYLAHIQLKYLLVISCSSYIVFHSFNPTVIALKAFFIFSKKGETTVTTSTSTSSSTALTTTTTTTSPNGQTHDSDDELETSRLVDVGVIFDEWINNDETYLNDEDDGDADYVPILADQDESDSYSDSSDDDNNSTFTQSQQDRRIQEEEEEQEMEQLLSNPDELKKRISCLLKKIRKLIKMINKSSILTTFVRDEIKRRQIDLDAAINSTDEKKVKVNDLVNDFHIRWNSTFIMLARLWAAQQIVNDITYSPQSHIGLTAKQIKKLRSLQNNRLEWELIESLANVLAPFYFATKCLSGRQYATLLLSYWITNHLFFHLTSEKPDCPLENGLRNLLFDKFNLYFNTNVTHEQRHAKLVRIDR